MGAQDTKQGYRGRATTESMICAYELKTWCGNCGNQGSGRLPFAEALVAISP